MSIRNRIILLVALSLAALLIIGGYAIVQSRSNAVRVKEVTEGIVQSAIASAELVARLKDVQILTMEMVSATDSSLATRSKEKLQAQHTSLREALDLQEKQVLNDRQAGLVKEAKESFDNYFNSIMDTATLALAGNKQMAEAMLFATVAQYQQEMAQVAETLRIEKNRSKEEALAELNQALVNSIVTIGIVTISALLGLGFLGWLLYGRVVVPIGNMQKMMTRIADTHDYSNRLPVGSKDEIGQSIEAFNAMIGEIQASSALLRQKTIDVETMLQNMPQGILTITEGNQIHPEYSRYLETIFETKQIAWQNVMDVVFSDTNLGADTLAQLEAVTGACIGEDEMNFEFNAHLLVGEVEKRMPDGRVKVLDINWSPISDDKGTITRLLVCIRDVTELRKLAAEAHAQKRELELIGEILGVSADKFHDFINSAIKLVDENEIILRDNASHSADAIALLFRNMHTIKGNARTYGLAHLTNLVHEVEQTYEELRKPRPTIAWDQQELLASLEAVRQLIEHYAHINEVSLGRKNKGHHPTTADHYLLVDPKQIQATIAHIESINNRNPHELIAAAHEISRVLRLLGTEEIADTLSGIFDALPALAKDLGKLPPVVTIEERGCFVRNEAGPLLKNVFMHLVRNAMDHGIEDPDARRAAGKEPAGQIKLVTDVVGKTFQIVLQDDGRGLALRKIREIALSKALVPQERTLKDEEIAELIFHPGFSTADQVTDVSGRGVGMDAVRGFLQKAGGKIEIRFMDDKQGADFRAFQMVVTLPEGLVVQLSDEELDAIRKYYRNGDVMDLNGSPADQTTSLQAKHSA